MFIFYIIGRNLGYIVVLPARMEGGCPGFIGTMEVVYHSKAGFRLHIF